MASSTSLLLASSTFLLYLFASHAFPVQHLAHSVIPLGSSISPTTEPSSWRSPSGLFAFGFYNQGDHFAVGIWLETRPNKTVVWTANRDEPPLSSNTTLLLTDGGVLLRTVGSHDKPIAGDITTASSGSMLDSGNFVLYDSSSKIIWETFGLPTDSILGGQQLLQGNQLCSRISDTNHSTGRFRLKMQTDGNLVQYPKGTEDTSANAYWASDTAGELGVSLYLNANGSLNLVNDRGSIIKPLSYMPSRNSNGTIFYRATLDADGIFRLYSHNFKRDNISTVSSDVTFVHDRCRVKGICSINSYCTQMDAKYDCLCLPGYHFTDANQRFLGCSRNFSDHDCMGKKDRMTYFMSPEKNMVWDDSSYELLALESEGDCSDNCLEDCNCGAAMFDRKTCKKMMTPLKYGRRDTSSSVTTLIKMGRENPVSAKGPPFMHVTRFIEIQRKNQPDKKIVIVSVTIAICFAVILAITILLLRCRIQRYRKTLEARNIRLSEEIVLRSYSYDELHKATSNFRQELGRGAFGTVYKGAISNGTRTIAVKRLEKVVEEGEREFRAEMRAIGRTHHRNLVRLIGFCDEGSSRLLVYEYMSNGSLADLLFKAKSRPSWNERVTIALDVARGIHYLHEDCEPHIIHCDIKPQNILMDDFWTAKISDFGLAKLLAPDQTRTFTGIRGTRGYLAPEWQKNTPISVKADVYSYGIVLLEIICCRRNVELEVPENEIILHEWVYNCFEARKLGELMGKEEVEVRMLERMVKVGLWCIQNEPALRPSMKNVILMLGGFMEIPIPPSPASSSMS